MLIVVFFNLLSKIMFFSVFTSLSLFKEKKMHKINHTLKSKNEKNVFLTPVLKFSFDHKPPKVENHHPIIQ